jgi:DNA-binding beta-propeller fold protein YncE
MNGGSCVKSRGSRPVNRRRARVGLAAVCASLAALALSSPAFADRPYDCQITGSSTPSASECNGVGNAVPGGAFRSPHGLAVDSSGNLWVADAEHAGGAVDEFSSSGDFLSQSSGTPWSGYYIYGVSFRNASSQLYVTDSDADDVYVLNSNGSYSGTDIVGDWGGGCCYIFDAVDNSGTATDGDVYISSDGHRTVYRINGAGAVVNFSASASYISANTLTGTPAHNFGQLWGVATDPSGDVYVLDLGNKEVDEFAPSGTFVQAFTSTGTPDAPFGTLSALAVDPTNGDVLIADNGQHLVHEFDSSGGFVGDIAGTDTPAGSFQTIQGLAADSSGLVYISDHGSGHNVVDVFDAGVVLPKITYGAVTNQTQTAGTLNANVDPNEGGDVTACHFEYGTTPAYSSGSVPCTPDPASSPPASNFSVPTDVSAELSGLTTETPYHYRVVVSNANGTRKGPDQVYLPHAVAGLTTDAASSVDRNSATLNASFNGNGEDTHYYFEWGTDSSYGNTTAAPPGTDAGSPSGPHGLSSGLTGLTVETTYHYRIVASNAVGTSYGGDQSFTTLAAVKDLSTDPATDVTASTATLNASYTGIGEDVHYYFEYGSTTSYGSETAPAPGTDNGSPSGPQTLSFDLAQLQINGTYHYRVVASDTAGTSYGVDQSFTTLGAYDFSTDYGSAGSGDGQLMGPRDVAIDNSNGDVYVADTSNSRIVKLDSSGNFLAAWGWGVSDGNPVSEVCSSSCQAGIAGAGAGQFTAPRFVEVDNSTGPSAGDVYVADTSNKVVQKFDSAGNLITTWGTNGAIDFSSGNTIGGIAVDVSGNLFVVTQKAPYIWTEVGQDGVSRVEIPTDGSYNAYVNLGAPNGAGIEVNAGNWYELDAAGGGVLYSSPDAHQQETERLYANGGSVNSGIVIDRDTNDVYVDQGTHIDQFTGSARCGGVDGGGCTPSDTFGSGHLTGASGLAFDPATGTIYAANTGANNLALFTPLPVAKVSTGGVENPSSESGTLTGHVDPGTGTVSACYFQYGTDTSYGLGIQPCSPGTPLSAPSDVTADVSGLTPFATYHYRLVAIRADGKGFPSYGRDQTFTPAPMLPPSVDATSSSDETPTTVTLHAQINPNLSPTLYRFQYGTQTSYGYQTPPSESIGADGVDHPISSTLSGLEPATNYHFRVVAVNFNGPTSGPDQTFTTPGLPTVSTGSATQVTDSSATLNASIQAGFRATTYHFEYGRTDAYGSSTSESGLIGSDNAVRPVSADISGLAPDTAYHFRIVATNEIGTAAGPDQTFATGSAPVITPPPPSCKKGFVRRGGKCVRKHHKRKHRKRHHRRKHHRRSHQ